MINNIKLIATDLDGTFFNNNSAISDYNKDVFQFLMKNGIEIILATGRALNSMKHYKDILANDNYSIIFNGAAIIDNDGNFIYDKVIDANTSKSIINIYDKYNVYLHVYKRNIHIASDIDFYLKKYIEKEKVNNVAIGLENIEDFEFNKDSFVIL